MEENNSSFASFMQDQSAPKKSDAAGGSEKSERKKTALEIKQEEDKKELDEAKKESKSNAAKYATAQANLIAAEGRRFLLMLPFIICGVLIFVVIITKGGSWIQAATQYGMSKLRGE